MLFSLVLSLRNSVENTHTGCYNSCVLDLALLKGLLTVFVKIGESIIHSVSPQHLMGLVTTCLRCVKVTAATVTLSCTCYSLLLNED